MEKITDIRLLNISSSMNINSSTIYSHSTRPPDDTFLMNEPSAVIRTDRNTHNISNDSEPVSNSSKLMMLVDDFSDYFYNHINYSVINNSFDVEDDVVNESNCSLNGSTFNGSCFVRTSEELKKLEYNLWALLLVIFPVLTLFGNVLVILSVVRERSLQTVTNYFIVSLAVADLLVAVVVMPFGLYYLMSIADRFTSPLWKRLVQSVQRMIIETEGVLHHPLLKVNGVWGLPAVVCDCYIAMDVTSSTSSILNLVAISVDRFIAVTQPIKYARHTNKRRVWVTIGAVWLVSAGIGSPIVLGLNNTPDRSYRECLFNSSDYIIYSSLGSFYIPCICMMFLYYRIFMALRVRARKQRAARKPPACEAGPGAGSGTAAVVIENVATRGAGACTTGGTTPGGAAALQETALDCDRPTGTGSGSNDYDQESLEHRSVELGAEDDCPGGPAGSGLAADTSADFTLDTCTVTDETIQSSCLPASDPNGNTDSGYVASQVGDLREPCSPPASPLSCLRATVLQNHACYENGDKSHIKKNGVKFLKSSFKSPVTPGQQKLCFEEGSGCKNERQSSSATRFTIYKANKASKKKREKSSAKKERKATKTLAIVLGVFLFCWAPFFTCSVVEALCGKFGVPYSPGVTAFILTTWLGYINSFLNPVIYTIFNPEFRKAFKKILRCGT